MSDVTKQGQELIDRWVEKTAELAQAKHAVISAECNYANARNALGKWLMPHDASPGERFAVWNKDSLIEVTVTNGDPELRIRTRGRHGL